jgi:DNA-binding XRE family transcriptional regulator
MPSAKPFANLRAEIDQSPERRRRVRDMKRAMLDVQRLAGMRVQRGLTQKGVADALDVSQANISRIEHEDDLYLSTLRAYVEALGGELDISARFSDGEVIKVG